MPPKDVKVVASNRQARRDYDVLDTVECLALVPLSLYFKEGRAKVEVALGRGRRNYDKRQAIAKRDADREAQRGMARAAKENG
jgi:tmRNA-binding protein